MSYPGVDPVDTQEEPSAGSPVQTLDEPALFEKTETPEGKLVVTPPIPEPLRSASDSAHERAFNAPDTDPPKTTEELNALVAKAVDDMFAINEAAWSPKIIVKFKIHLPSGQVALVKHLDTLDLVEHDLIEELDFFTRKLFPDSIDLAGNPVDAKKAAEDNIWKALRDPVKRCRFLDMTGKLMATASLKPKIVHDGVAVVEVTDPETGERRKGTKFGYELNVDEQIEHFKRPIPKLAAQQVYSGYVDFADRMVFFQELNKPLELIQPFREEQTAMLQDMARSEGDGGTT